MASSINKKTNFAWDRGTSYTIGIVYEKDGVAHTLVGATVLCTVKDVEFDDSTTDATSIIPPKNITTGNAQGEADIVFTPAETAEIEPGEYFYDVKVDEDSDGVNVYKILEGKITLGGSPTNRLLT